MLTNVSLTYGAIFLGLCLAAHVVLRFTLPYADPYLFPLFAVLACFGLVMIYRIDDDARARAGAVVRHRAGASSPRRSSCCATTACSSATATRSPPSASGCCCCRACPASASRSTAPTSASRLGPLTFQPAEFAKIAIIVFLASYLRDTRQLLVIGARRVRRDHDPAAQALRAAARRVGRGDADALLHPGPRLVADVLRRLPGRRSTWRPTASRSWPSASRCSPAGAWVLYHARPTITHRVDAWLHPFGALYDQVGGSYQIAQSLFAQADGGLFGRGFGAGAAEGRRLAAAARGADRPHLLGDRQRARA